MNSVNGKLFEIGDSLMPTYKRFDVEIVSGKGAIAIDVSGKEYIDFGAGIGVNSLGYADHGWADAISKQAHTLQHTSNLYHTPLQKELARELCNKTGFASVFLANSGAEANECAIKLARKYSKDKYGAGRSTIITLNNSFHGRTITTLAASAQDGLHTNFDPFTPGFFYVPAGDIEALDKAMDGSVCAVMLEPVQGEGGVLPVDTEYLKVLARLAHKRDVLLIYDEVQTGVGRTGKLYAYEHLGITPDILTSAKGLGGGLPIGVCMAREKLANVLSSGSHGSTFGGNPVVCAGALYTLSKIANEQFLNEVTRKGNLMKTKLEKMQNVKSVRGLGMMIGVELEKGVSREIAEKCVENGVLVLTAKSLLRFLPPLNISDEEIEAGLSVVEKVLSEIE